MKRLVCMTSLGAAALLSATPAAAEEAQTIDPFWGTKPVVRALQGNQLPMEPVEMSPEAFARWDAAQGKPVVVALRSERERYAPATQGFTTVASRCWGTKPAVRGSCAEEGLEVGSASGQP